MIELAANLLVAFLLVLTTSWCALLYRRLDRLRVERSDIEAFLAAVDGAVRRAEAGDRRHPRRRAARRSACSRPSRSRPSSGRPSWPAWSTAPAGWHAGSRRAIHQGARAMAEESLDARARRRRASSAMMARGQVAPARLGIGAERTARTADRRRAAQGARGAAVSQAQPPARAFAALSGLLLVTRSRPAGDRRRASAG